MQTWFSELITILSEKSFFLALIIFFGGYLSSLLINHYHERFTILSVFLILPNFISRQIKKLLEIQWSFAGLFLFIFSFNLLSVYSGFLSGFIIGLPYFLLFLTGINIGIIALMEGDNKALLIQILNPVAILEILALCIAYSRGFFLKPDNYTVFVWKEKIMLHFDLLPVLIRYSFLFLFIAALMEVPIIFLLKKFKIE